MKLVELHQKIYEVRGYKVNLYAQILELFKSIKL